MGGMKRPTNDERIVASLRAGPKHGVGIIDDVETGAYGPGHLAIASLYVALTRLIRAGVVDVAGMVEVDGERVKVYQLRDGSG